MGQPVILRSQSLGLEVQRGVPVAPTLRLLGASKLRVVRPVESVRLMDGQRAPVDMHLSGKLASLVDHRGPLAFENIPMLFVMALDPQPGIVQSQQYPSLWHWSFRGRGEGLRSATWDWSDAGRAQHSPNTLLQHLEISAVAPRNALIDVKLMLVGQKPFTAGTGNQAVPIGQRTGAVGSLSRIYIDTPPTPFGSTRLAGAVRGWKFAINQTVLTYDLHDGSDTWAIAYHAPRSLGCEIEIRRVVAELAEEDSWTGWVRRRVRLSIGAHGTIVVDPGPGGIPYGYGISPYGLSPYGNPDWLNPNLTAGGGGVISDASRQILHLDLEGYWSAQDWEDDNSIVSRYTLMPGFQHARQSDIGVNLITTTATLEAS